MSSEPLPLEGIRILDLTRVLAGPYCTMMLGDLGADVIKVEAPGRGDDTRAWGPPFTDNGESAYFLSANRNKRSMTLNLKTTGGLEVLKRLIAESDVLVENFKTGTLAGWGLDETALQDLRPDLIYCTITGYGYSGPYSDRPGYDFMVQALGGFMSVTGPADGKPYRAGVAIADLSAGIFACNAVLAALFKRERTGSGSRIDLSLLDSQVAIMSYVASNFLVSGVRPGRYGNGHPNIVPYQEFRAKDGHFAFAAGNDRQWAIFCQAVGKDDWVEDERFATNEARVRNRELVSQHLADLFTERDVSEWLDLCLEIGIPAAPINSIDQVFEDPQVQSRGLRIEANHPETGAVPMVASPLRFGAQPLPARIPPPRLGEHTRDILSEIGYRSDELSALRESGAI